MNGWWHRQSLKLRLAVWFTAVASLIMLALTPAVYILIERRLHAELDRQLQVDWNLIAAHLEQSEDGRIQWKKSSPSTPSSPGYAETWFDVWAHGEDLLSHWPVNGVRVTQPPTASIDGSPLFLNLVVDRRIPARAYQHATSLDGREVTVRVFRDESGLRRALREILAGLFLGIPLAAALAAVGGYWMAGRTLKPISDMAEQARQITSESLSRRLPNPNPHDELGQMAAVFNETLQRLEASFESLKRFTADASHELRTPLTALRTVGEVALRENGDPKALRDTIGSMLEEAQRLNDLIDTMLLLARAESGRVTVPFEPVNLASLLQEISDSVEVLAAEKKQRIELSGDSGLTVPTAQLLLRPAVLNVLHNAIRYSPPGTRILMRWFTEGDHAVVEVADEGPGIAPEHREKIFERFYRIDKARSRAEGGAGLGLAIAKLSVEQLGGRIELWTELGQGSRFRLILPQR